MTACFGELTLVRGRGNAIERGAAEANYFQRRDADEDARRAAIAGRFAVNYAETSRLECTRIVTFSPRYFC